MTNSRAKWYTGT